MKIKLFIAIIFLFACTVTSQAATLVDYYPESNYDTSLTMGSSTLGFYSSHGQSFTGSSGVLNSVKFYVKKNLNPTGNAYAKIYNITGTYGTDSKPTGAYIAISDPLDVSTLSNTTLQLKSFNFSGLNKITLGTGYYVVAIEYPIGDSNNYLAIGRDNSSPTHQGNRSRFDGSNWSTISATGDLIFYVYNDSPITRVIKGHGITR